MRHKGIQLQNSKSSFKKLLKIDNLECIKYKQMFPVAKSEDLNTAVIEIPVKMGGNINCLYFLSYCQKLTKTKFYLFMPKVDVKTATVITLVRGKII